MRVRRLGFLLIGLGWWASDPVLALPPPDEVPEEILRIQPVWETRSPVDNQPLSPEDYEALRVELAENQTGAPELSPKLKQLVQLLRLRKLLKTLIPFF